MTQHGDRSLRGPHGHHARVTLRARERHHRVHVVDLRTAEVRDALRVPVPAHIERVHREPRRQLLDERREPRLRVPAHEPVHRDDRRPAGIGGAEPRPGDPHAVVGHQENANAGTFQWCERACWTFVIAGQAYRRTCRPAKVELPMAPLVLLTDRTPEAALPALSELRPDLKVEPLAVASLAHVRELEPEVRSR